MHPHFPIEHVIYPSEADSAHWTDTGAWHSSPLGTALRQIARSEPRKPALVTIDRSVTYSELDDTTETVANNLAALGLVPGDRVMFQMGSTIETVIALLACAKAALIPVCALPQHRKVEIRALTKLTLPRAYIVQADFSQFDLVAFAAEIADEFSIPHLIVARGLSTELSQGIRFEKLMKPVTRPTTLLSGCAIGLVDVLMLQLSGGTTNIPKLIPRFHGEHLGQAMAWARRIEMAADTVSLYNMPLIHNAGLVANLYPCLLVGGKFVLADRAEPEQYFSLIERERVTHSMSIGPAAHKMLEYEGIKNHDLSSLRVISNFNGSRAMERHIDAKCLNIYGITEGFIMSSQIASSESIRFDTVGWPVHELDEFRIVFPGTDTEVQPGEVGEFCFRGPSSIRGYYKGEAVNRTSFTETGFFRTGDLLASEIYEGERCCVFRGRIKDNIDRGGEKFGAEEVEFIVEHHPDVLDSKVVAMPDEVYGEKACVFLVLRPHAEIPTVKSLGQFLLAQGLAKYKLPERVEVIDSIPITNVGKADKQSLRDLILRKLAVEEFVRASTDI